MFKFFSRKKEEKRRHEELYQMGRDTGAAMYDAIESYLAPRLAEISGNLLMLLEDRFALIYDQPEHDPKLIAKIEWDIFNEQLDTCPVRLRKELEENCDKWLSIASQLDVRHFLDEKIRVQITENMEELRLAGQNRRNASNLTVTGQTKNDRIGNFKRAGAFGVSTTHVGLPVA